MAFDTYMELAGVDGSAVAKGMEKKMELYSFSWGASNPTSVGSGATGLAAGKVSVSSFNVMKKSEAASAMLFMNCCTGTHFANATVFLRKATGTDGGQQTFLQYKFTDLLVESIQWSGSHGGDDTPTESVSFAFAKVEIEYLTQDNKGKVSKTAAASFDQTKVAK